MLSGKREKSRGRYNASSSYIPLTSRYCLPRISYTGKVQHVPRTYRIARPGHPYFQPRFLHQGKYNPQKQVMYDRLIYTSRYVYVNLCLAGATIQFMICSPSPDVFEISRRCGGHVQHQRSSHAISVDGSGQFWAIGGF